MPAALLISALLSAGCGGQSSPDAAAAPEVAPPQAPVLSVGRVPAEDGVPIAYTSRGAGETALVFVHGWACDQGYWRHQAKEPLTEKYRVVTVDLPGHGESGLEREQWSIEGFGEDLAAVVIHLGLERTILIGHSMGGGVILEAAGHLDEQVIGLVGVETFHDAGFEVPEEQWQQLISAYRQDYDATCRTMVGSMFPAPGELATSVQDDMCGGPQDVGIALLDKFGAYRAADPMGELGELPIRAINGEHSLPTRVEANRAYSPGFDAVIQEGVGHFPMLEDPERFDELLMETLAAVEAAAN